MTVHSGEVVALLGPNGAGKTTLLEAIEGYREPASGTVKVFGVDPFQDRNLITLRWGVMPQTGGIPMGLTVLEAVRLFADLHGYTGNTKALIADAGLSDLSRRRWRRLSGGEQQRLSLALALCGGKDLLILDEPTAAVDSAGRQRILDVIRQRSSDGAAVLITTHRFDDVEAVADRVVILNKGKVVGAGTVDDLTSGGTDIKFTARPDIQVEELSTSLGCTTIEYQPGYYQLNCPPTPDNIAAVTSWMASNKFHIGNLQAGRQSLEDVFTGLTNPSMIPNGDLSS